ncbi:dicarboxylate/amino acid:cation symporter [Treponema phagedenis]|uniref:Dicarboxylate/amino acid:cation symporter n=1 Tax=Treponema phagedenis TaxID=162 RepID=A0A0B7GW82_TREPH|nr:dicarboxylate/amino acid:cation symporter [Treponema phagedenis]EFW37975.1 transporter, dicarboxylate/amino acid:cation Na+/H+ symporter family protein [Treponema phagedenis F0421]NVP23426.1 dicarboxylate/amino acid:cation symporter [Treponema phagedenis]QEJ95643.1 dicarboxylate/amino acid:cation symporter [Treponema phagedenis]QEJ98567.1 dicarboxylate/amino acid:cation symporter [Treponema phagedenis]QEK01499.1 dicarboxylate/amino acid:cation symporter [Treponema phagedenis]
MSGKFKLGLLPSLGIGIAAGVLLGLLVPANVMGVLHSIKGVLGSIIFFAVPLVIFGFIAPAICNLKNNAGKMLGVFLGLSYVSAVGASLFSAIAGYILIPFLHVSSTVEGLKDIPTTAFVLDIPPLMPVMTALVMAILVGISVIWTKASTVEKVLNEFQAMVLEIVNRIIVPILPFFIATTFAELAYSGSLTVQLPVFLKIIVIVIVGHFIWMTLLYLIGGLVSKKNPLEVVKHYGPAYTTAIGTMSSAATLPVALRCAHKSKVLPAEIADFAIPLGATTHLCGSVLTETFFCLVISQLLYGTLPSIGTMVLFSVLFGVFAVGAPGVPGGTVMASLGLVISVLGFDQTGTGLLIAIFALQDSFGTACNVTGDGALALILRGIFYNTDGTPKEIKS